MDERFTSEQLLSEVPRPLINFIWYLWEMYCDPDTNTSLIELQPHADGQGIAIPHVDKTVVKDFGVATNATILIRKDGEKYYMSRK